MKIRIGSSGKLAGILTVLKSNYVECLKYNSSFILLFCLLLQGIFLTGCNKVADVNKVKNATENKGELHTDSFRYVLNIYDANGRESIYIKTSIRPLTQLDSNNFIEESLLKERKNK